MRAYESWSPSLFVSASTAASAYVLLFLFAVVFLFSLVLFQGIVLNQNSKWSLQKILKCNSRLRFYLLYLSMWMTNGRFENKTVAYSWVKFLIKFSKKFKKESIWKNDVVRLRDIRPSELTVIQSILFMCGFNKILITLTPHL